MFRRIAIVTALATLGLVLVALTFIPPHATAQSGPAASGWVRVNYAHDWVGVNYNSGHTFWITVTDSGDSVKATAAVSTTSSGGWGDAGFETNQGNYWSPQQPNIETGDRVYFRSDDGYTNVITVGVISGRVNAATDAVSGTVTATWFSQTLNVECHPWGGPPGTPQKSSTAAPNGSSPYFCQWNPVTEWNILPGQDVAVMYIEPDGDRVINVFQAPTVRVNYGDDWVEANYEAGHTVWITLTNSGGTLKATAVLTTGAVPWWGGQTGFSTNWQGWIPSQPDIVPEDRVDVRADDGYTTTVRIGTINGELNVAADTISGTITANWLTQTFDARCEVWVKNGPPGIDMTVNPNKGGSYSCDFGAVGWDVLPGQDVAVMYFEPDRDQVIKVFRGPAPDLRVEKWVEGGGEVAPGGAVIFGIRYQNNGDGAGEAILTDTLPLSTTYVTDTSGFPAFVSGNVITWNLGSVAPYTVPIQFQLVLTNAANPDDTLRNVIDIGTLYEKNWGNNHAEAKVQVGSGQPDLYVKKDAQPGDPTPGQLFRYNINYGNNGPVASGPVWLTDTLPLSTTFVSWQSENGYSLWTTVVTTGGKVALYAPTLPGNYGDTIYLTLRLSDTIPYDTQLINTVEITTTGDSNPDDNEQANGEAWASPPRYNVSVDKSWSYGALTPGGEINYNVHYNNGGNSPASNAVLTDTLPAGTTLITSVVDLGWGVTVPFPPSSIVGNKLVWNLGTLQVNENKNWRIALQITPTTPVGTVITNCVAIAIIEWDRKPYDNTQCAAETVRAAGTNLRVTKFADWQGQGGLRYRVNIENIGTQTVNAVTITDTFPVAMTLNNLNVKFWEQWSSGVSGNQLTVTLNRLEPGWSVDMNMQMGVPSVPNGTLFTNTVEMTTPPDDVNPADNHDVIVVGTGPDLSVEKWLTGGTPKAGQLLTYTLHLQNHSQAWGMQGQVWVTDTLPAGLEFVTSTQRLCGGGTYFCPRAPDYSTGMTMTWSFDQWDSNNWNDLLVTVRVTDTAKGGTVFTNTATIASDDPANDVEPFYNDNTSVVTATIIQYKVYLPVIVRN